MRKWILIVKIRQVISPLNASLIRDTVAFGIDSPISVVGTFFHRPNTRSYYDFGRWDLLSSTERTVLLLFRSMKPSLIDRTHGPTTISVDGTFSHRPNERSYYVFGR
ncbi:hypothetical protein [Neobacillus sp. FSL H8-0543]|uniref:hypothetical protein n=1 Tax=Neobacillus sp. FSL H8-0543 TaxID=2954672 RepID=UPI00315909E6